MSNQRMVMLLAQAAIAAMVASSLQAQELAEGHMLEEMVVTAQKREERLFDVPMSVTAMSGEELTQRGVSSYQDLAFAVPGVTTREDGPGSYQVFMRGLANQYGPGALVGVYLDEVPVSLTGYDQLDIRVMDLERVEVLKGPQGTLYGQGSLAGTVRYITRDPDLTGIGGSLEGAVASVEHGDLKTTATGVLNLPVASGVFALRLAATMEDGGGWIDQPEADIEDGNDTELSNVRLKALWQVTDRFIAEAMAIRHRADTRLGLGYEQPDRTVDVGIDPSRVLIPKEFDYDLYNVDFSIDLGFAELLSASAYIDHDHQYPFSYKGGADTIYGGGGFLEGTDERFLDMKQFSQELRLSAAEGSSFEWTVGAFYRDVERDFFAIFDTLFDGTVFPGGEFTDNDTYEEFSVFAQTSYAVTDRLEIGAGVRYFEDDQTTFNGVEKESDSFDSVDPRVYVSYSLSQNANVYASASQGFRSGGFNAGDLPNFEPEELTSYELGTKARFQDGLFDVELVAYYSDYKDMLRRGLVFVDQQFQSLVSNIGEAEIKGLEGALTWRPTDDLSFSGTFAFIDAEVKEVDADDATNVAGDPIDYVPDVSYTLGAFYDFAWTPSLPGFLRVDFSYRDELPYIDRSSFPAENVPQLSDEIKLLDARLGMTWNRTTVELFGTNLTDENQFVDPYHAWNNANRTRPRTVGLNVRFDFDQ